MENLKTTLIGTLLEAHLCYTSHNAVRGHELLSEGMVSAREIEFTTFGCLPNEIMAQLCARALVENIEVDFVRNIILKNGLDSISGQAVSKWPVPVKIYSLGRFAVTVNGAPLAGKGNAQRRPVELLQTIIALGGRDVCIQKICDCVWPDVEGDAAYQNFTVTLFRLRKLVGNHVITLQDRRVTLDSRQCWVDVWDLERLMGKLEGLGNHYSMPYGEITEAMDRILTLYNGPFLGEGEVNSWSLSLRERLRSRFIRILMVVAQTYEQMDNCDEAIIIYQKALELDPLAEEFHQRLISCLASLGRYAEAITAFKRCEQVLASLLRVQPAQETLAIYKELQKQQQPELHVVSSH